MKWKMVPFDKLFIDCTGGNKKLKQSEYLDTGILPIVDQGQKFIAGYTNDKEASCKVAFPCITFGDHTRAFKLIDFPFALGADGVKVLQPTKDVDARFAYFYLDQVKLAGKEGYQRNFKYLKQVSIPLPPLPIQKQIAAILEKADAAREKRRQANKLTEQFLQSAFLEMFGDPVTNPKGWKKISFGELCEEIRYGTSIQCHAIKDVNDFPVLRIPNIIGGSLNKRELKFTHLPESERKTLIMRNGDILFVRSNGNPEYIGRCAVFNEREEFLFASYLIRARLKRQSKISPVFAKDVFNFPSYRSMVVKYARTTAGNYNINTVALRSLNVILPPMDLQDNYLTLVEKVESLRAKQRESEKELENLFGSLMQKAFKGELVG